MRLKQLGFIEYFNRQQGNPPDFSGDSKVKN